MRDDVHMVESLILSGFYYYDVRLEEARLAEPSVHPSFVFIKGSIVDKSLVESVFKQYQPTGRC